MRSQSSTAVLLWSLCVCLGLTAIGVHGPALGQYEKKSESPDFLLPQQYQAVPRMKGIIPDDAKGIQALDEKLEAEYLIRELNSKSSNDHRYAMDRLLYFKAHQEMILPHVIALINAPGEDEYTRKWILGYVRSAGEEGKAAIPELIKLLNNSKRKDHFRAALLLGSYGPEGKAALPKLKQMYANSRDYRSSVIQGMLLIEGPPYTEAFARLKAGDYSHQREHYKAIGDLGVKARKLFPRLLSDYLKGTDKSGGLRDCIKDIISSDEQSLQIVLDAFKQAEDDQKKKLSELFSNLDAKGEHFETLMLKIVQDRDLEDSMRINALRALDNKHSRDGALSPVWAELLKEKRPKLDEAVIYQIHSHHGPLDRELLFPLIKAGLEEGRLFEDQPGDVDLVEKMIMYRDELLPIVKARMLKAESHRRRYFMFQAMAVLIRPGDQTHVKEMMTTMNVLKAEGDDYERSKVNQIAMNLGLVDQELLKKLINEYESSLGQEEYRMVLPFELMRMGSAAVPTIIKIYQDKRTDQEMKLGILQSLAQMGPAAAPAMPFLFDMLPDPDLRNPKLDNETQVAVERVLYSINPEAGLPFLEERIKAGNKVDLKKADRLLRFWGMNESEKMAEYKDHPLPLVRRHAAGAGKRFVDTLEALIQKMRSQDREVAGKAALDYLKQDPYGKRPVPELLKIMNDPAQDARTRKRLIRSMVYYTRYRPEICAALVWGLKQNEIKFKDRDSQRGSLELPYESALTEAGVASLPYLLEMAKDPVLEDSAIDVLTRLNYRVQPAAKVLVSILEKGDKTHYDAHYIMSDAGPQIVPDLLKLLESDDPKVRIRALDILDSIDPPQTQVTKHILPLVKDKDRKVAIKAMDALSRINEGSTQFKSDLMKTLVDVKSEGRYLALTALATHGQDDVKVYETIKKIALNTKEPVELRLECMMAMENMYQFREKGMQVINQLRKTDPSSDVRKVATIIMQRRGYAVE